MEQLDEIENKIAKEIGNIGSVGVGMVISQNAGIEIVIDATRTYIFAKEKFSALIDYLNKTRHSIDFKLQKNKGGLLVMFPRETDNTIIFKMKSKDKKSLSAMTIGYTVVCKDYFLIDDTFEMSKQYSKKESEILNNVIFGGEDGKAASREGRIFLIDTKFCWKEKEDHTGHIFLYFYDDGVSMVLEKIAGEIKR